MAFPEPLSASRYYFDDVAVDCENFRVLKSGEPRMLEPRAFDLLVYLIAQRGRTVEKQELFEQVWKDTFVTDSALTRAVKEVRRAIGDDASAPRYIETIPKRGYRFIAEVKMAKAARPSAPEAVVGAAQATAARRSEQLVAALNYRILSKLGEGGGGVVYLAEDTRLRRTVVLKFLPDELVQDDRARRRFLREARLASALDHPNICTIYEINEVDGLHFIAMQYVEGKTLKQVIANRPLDIEAAVAIAFQIAEALAAAHEQHIVHRDIKPGNIIITNKGQVKILDFGLAKSLAHSAPDESGDPTELTRQGAQLGTPAYMSPEQVRGEAVDHRSDIFSFGVILYEMVTGRSPFKGRNKTPVDVMHSVAHHTPQPAGKINAHVPEPLEAVIERAMQKAFAARYQSARELLDDLRKLKQDSQSGGAVIRRAVSRRRIAPRWLAYVGLALLALVIVGIGLRLVFRPSASHKTIRSVVVLPFTNGSQDPNAEYLSDGVTESIINSLSQVSELKVIARTTAFRYKGRDVDPQSVGRELNVEGVLTGKVTGQGDALLVQTELVNAADGTELWGEKYSRKLSDILTVQEEIARHISERLRLKLNGEEEKRLTRSYTDDAEAYQLYLKGRYHWNKRTDESYQKAIDYFRQAIAKDPNYALAYTGLADAYSFMSSQSISSPTEAMPLAKEAATHALALDDSLAEAHTSLAYILLYYDWNWAEAEEEYRRAIALNPSYATPHHGYAYLLISTGRPEEALAEISKAEELDPLSLLIHTDHGEFFYFLHQPAQAIAQLKKALDLDPAFVRAHFLLGRAEVQNGQCDEALAEFQKARRLAENSTEMLAALGQGYAWCGKKAEARQVLAQLAGLANQRYVSPHWFAATLAALGDKDQAFAWLDKAIERRFGPLIYLRVNPIWDDLRDDSRFGERLRRVGLAS
ncbi:MAG TPA: protein kinase [Blastocatellia bacterium]|nr:protein kinase [Blastocatellia bacterium]